MTDTLQLFTTETLFNAASALMEKLHIQFDRTTALPISIPDLWQGTMPQYLTESLRLIEDTYFIGIVNDGSLQGAKDATDLDEVEQQMEHEGKYDGMFLFACEAKPEATLTRTALATLTRAFNRLASANPVILFVRQGTMLSISTCERMPYTQQWRQGTGEKLGKVSILRNINCEHPHRGHVDILDSLGDKVYPTFEELYRHWLEVFSSELLTKKFYNELSDWYAWAVQIVRFPNDLLTDNDDAKFNHESCIRLITRLIFVWFLKQKHLIPSEFFNEDYIRENLIDNFDPHDKQNLYYNADESKYYRLILQNLFFAMLNCPIVAEGKNTPDNRRFMKESYHGMNPDYNIKSVMRYKKEFMEGGAEKFVKLANSNVPFLNGGLFDCLDNDNTKIYYDGFSERRESLEQLFFPDYLFFGEEVGKGIDLSQWYDDKKKKNVSARGIIDILKRYSFTIEENTPYDQEVSLDPELLGKVFENLLAAYNPETKQSARKQTGSFYTPREIVQYMVDESLVAHLKRMCGDEQEPLYRNLVSYAAEDPEMTDTQRKDIMHALYNCRVLDPACGSGAFPMGVLQQMVHVLKRIDPSNEMWEELVLEESVKATKKAFEENIQKRAATPEEQAEHDRQLSEATDDIEQAFNQSINDPDYARKLYLIEHCIYGVDIQPIATQISKLRFFISLVVDQKPTNDAKSNFGIRPLPNLEAKFVTANTLIPVNYNSNLVDNNLDVIRNKSELKKLNHKIFLAKKNSVKEKLREEIKATRINLAEAISNTGFVSQGVSMQLASWDMFDQNTSASFFDPEWMFGVKGGFDVVIGNPPYGVSIKGDYRKNVVDALGQVPDYEIYYYFIEISRKVLSPNAILSYIIPNTWLFNTYAKKYRERLTTLWKLDEVLDCSKFKIFDSATVINTVIRFTNSENDNTNIGYRNTGKAESFTELTDEEYVTISTDEVLSMNQNWGLVFRLNKKSVELVNKIKHNKKTIEEYFPKISQGLIAYDKYRGQSAEIIKNRAYHFSEFHSGLKKMLWGEDVRRYKVVWNGKEWIDYCDGIANPRNPKYFVGKRLLVREITNPSIYAAITEEESYNDPAIIIVKDNSLYALDNVLAILNSKLATFFHFNHSPKATKGSFPKILVQDIKDFPLAHIPQNTTEKLIALSENLQILDNNDPNFKKEEAKIDHIVYHLYNLTYDEVLVIDPETPITREEYENFKLD